MDREHERDFFQQEIQKLEEQMKNPHKLQTGSEQRNREVTGESSVLCGPGSNRDVHCCGYDTKLRVAQKTW